MNAPFLLIATVAAVGVLHTLVPHAQGLCLYSSVSLERVHLGLLERYGEVTSGIFIAIVRLVFYCGFDDGEPVAVNQRWGGDSKNSRNGTPCPPIMRRRRAENRRANSSNPETASFRRPVVTSMGTTSRRRWTTKSTSAFLSRQYSTSKPELIRPLTRCAPADDAAMRPHRFGSARAVSKESPAIAVMRAVLRTSSFGLEPRDRILDPEYLLRPVNSPAPVSSWR